ncbi:Alpha/Beta hydrolase protein [Plectosphaerella plurivora]|uniref:Alpha/Beta hydrolase protein n=1 Tax=Plectosphaerella plurivora TaxID=936078 RepID=A0A9P9ADJ5_9PEZI|nr:Alpha/Beta hydrolase protein [Plectosphaerella plurivora]
MPTWPLLCLAAQYAERVYAPPSGAERDAHVPSNWRTGTKAMVIKSVPMDHMSCIVFAIRGTATFADWAVNLNAAPAAPQGFLDDEDNLCHAGFLSVARSMIRPVASRLRQLLQEDPSRAGYSLVITGHSAGGAVASLLFCHMLAEATGKAASELNAVAGCFKRVHCVVFGTPPVSRRPLQKPTRPELAKSLFLSFLNEGDPVARADRAYVKSLLELFVSPAPKRRETDKEREKRRKEKREKPRFEREKGRKGSETVKVQAEAAVREKKSVVRFAETEKTEEEEEKVRKERREKRRRGPIWKVPPSSLSSPGRIVVLRSNARGTGVRRTVEDRLGEGVIAQTVTDEQLRGVVWGDPVCHVMRLYAGRIEALAVGAVTGKG